MSIPKIIHQMWIGPKKPPADEMETWKDFHPDWQYILWNENSLSENFPEGLFNQQQYNQMLELPGKCDIARYEILHKFGGVFIDADSICLRPLDEELMTADSFSCYENEKLRGELIANGYLATVKDNKLMAAIIRKIHKLNLKKPWYKLGLTAWKKVGPRLLTETVKEMKYKKLVIYPSYFFIPQHYTGYEYKGSFLPYCNHLWGSTPKSSYNYPE